MLYHGKHYNHRISIISSDDPHCLATWIPWVWCAKCRSLVQPRTWVGSSTYSKKELTPCCIIGHSRQPKEVCCVAGFNVWKELNEKLTLDNNWNILTWGIAGQCLLLSSSTQWAEAVCQQTLLHPFDYHRYDVEDDALQYPMMIYSCAKESQLSHLKSWACITRPGNLSTPGKVGTWGVE